MRALAVRLPERLSVMLLLAAVAGSLTLGKVSSSPLTLRVGVLFAAIAFVVGIGFWSARLLLLGLVCWLTVLGFLRRIVDVQSGSVQHDVLLLVGPLGFTVLVLLAAQQGAFQRRTRLAKAVLALSVLIVLGALNPAQGNLAGGIAGLLFVLVPTLAFWVGRSLLDDRTVRQILGIVVVLGLVAAIYGLAQTFHGFPSWDQAWIQDSGYTALNVGGVIRPFSVFSSAAEYGYFAALGIVVLVGYGFSRGRVLVVPAAVGLLAVAIAYESSRTVVVTLAGALGLMIAARHRVRFVTAVAAGAVAVVALGFAVRYVAPTGGGGTAQATLLQHQAAGLSNPLDPNSSTALIHLDLIRIGVQSAFTRPFGEGIGTVTIAGSKFGGIAAGTEADPSNAGAALGLPGLVAYLFVLAAALSLAYRSATPRDPTTVIALGVVVLTTFQWLNGGQYAVAYLPWLLLGWLDRRALDRDREATT